MVGVEAGKAGRDWVRGMLRRALWAAVVEGRGGLTRTLGLGSGWVQAAQAGLARRQGTREAAGQEGMRGRGGVYAAVASLACFARLARGSGAVGLGLRSWSHGRLGCGLAGAEAQAMVG